MRSSAGLLTFAESSKGSKRGTTFEAKAINKMLLPSGKAGIHRTRFLYHKSTREFGPNQSGQIKLKYALGAVKD